jgi:SpoVK/Ycf46/Vps4 family AAA+-type ATPase
MPLFHVFFDLHLHSSFGFGFFSPQSCPHSLFAVGVGRFVNLGGIESCMQEIRDIVQLMFTHIEVFKHLGSSPPRGLLLHGLPGCGKTLLAHAIAGEYGVPMVKVSRKAEEEGDRVRGV